MLKYQRLPGFLLNLVLEKKIINLDLKKKKLLSWYNWSCDGQISLQRVF